MANYCIHCGTVLHPEYGLCPHCNGQRLNQMIYAARAYGPGPQQAFASQPAVAQPIPVVHVTEKKKRKPLLKILTAAVMTVLLLALCLVAMGIFSIRQATTQAALTTMVESAEISDIVALLGPNGEKLVYGPIKSSVLETTGLHVKNQTIDEVLEAAGFQYYLAEKGAVYAKDIYDGTDNFAFRQKEIETLLRSNRKEMEKVLKISLSDDMLSQMADMLANHELTEQITLSLLKEKMPQIYYGLHFGLSYGAIAVLLAVAAMIWLSMLRMDFSLGILGGGVVLTVTGGILAIPALLIRLMPTLLTSLVSNGFLQSVIAGFLETNLIFSLLILSVGMALILVRASVLLLGKLIR